MLARVAMPAVRQKCSKLAPTSCQAASTIAAGTMAADVVASFMALLSFVDPAPRAYRLKVGNACPPYFNIDRDTPSKGHETVRQPDALWLLRFGACIRSAALTASKVNRTSPKEYEACNPQR